jgi:uncharacterized protein (UPF0335 family)
MGINTYNLQSVKKELQHLSSSQLTDLCLRLAKYKKENKELLSYMLFEAENENGYVQGIKEEVEDLYKTLPSHSYYQAKLLRKILKLIAKHAKFMASKPAEIDLLMHYCEQYLKRIERKITYKPLRQLLSKQLEKTGKLIGNLHEDLQFNYQADYEKLVTRAAETMSWINKHDYV